MEISSAAANPITCCNRYFFNKPLVYCSRISPAWRTKCKWWYRHTGLQVGALKEA
uniref:Uncharacterized protein n=1 Tax=Arundo donax TaxID=35708 RepID=A0A0A9BWG5_ARUDO